MKETIATLRAAQEDAENRGHWEFAGSLITARKFVEGPVAKLVKAVRKELDSEGSLIEDMDALRTALKPFA
jgi:hypothetical protein